MFGREPERQRLLVVAHQGHGAIDDLLGHLLMLARAKQLAEFAQVGEAILVEAELLLGGQHSSQRFVNARGRDDAGFDGMLDGGERLLDARRVEQNVCAGLQGAHGSFAFGVVRRDAAHVERVGEDDAVEVQLVAQHTGEYFR